MNILEELLHCPTAAHAKETIVGRAKERGAKVIPFGTTGICLLKGEGPLRIYGAHLDSPALRLKADPICEEEGGRVLAVEVYGGPLFYSWFDRPLSIAGRVATADGKMHLVEKKEVAIIPSLAIHLHRGVNENFAPKPSVDLRPMLLVDGSLEEILGVGEILSHELFLVPSEEPTAVGDFVSAYRIDDLSMVAAGLTAFFAEDTKTTKILLLLDHEEIGSHTREGAGSPLLIHLLEKLAKERGENLFSLLEESFLLSGDVAHGLHPNYKSAHHVHPPLLGGGMAIKSAAGRTYAGDVEGIAHLMSLARDAKVSLQHFQNHPDRRGGSTIGPILLTHTPVASAEIGIPILAMHASRELMHRKDYEDAVALITTYFRRGDLSWS